MKPFSQALRDDQRRKKMAGRGVAPDRQADDVANPPNAVPKTYTSGEPDEKKRQEEREFKFTPGRRPAPEPSVRKVIEIKLSMG